MAYAFRFYGYQPSDWAEKYLRYELSFVNEPELEQKETIASLFERVFSRGPAKASDESWYWAGAHGASNDVHFSIPGCSIT